MTSLIATVGQLSGKNPSRRIDELLSSWILPGEPIVGALHGAVRWQPTWLLLTESVVLQVRDGRSTTVEAIALIDEVTGYQEVPGWSGSALHIGTIGGQISLEQTDTQRTIAFVHAVERALGALSPSGVPMVIHPVVEALYDLEKSLKKLLQNREIAARLGERSPMECAISEFVLPYARGVSDPAGEGYAYMLLLWLLSLLQGDTQPRWIAAQNLWNWAKSTNDPQPLLHVHDSLPAEIGPDWRETLEAIGTALESAAYLRSSQQARASLLDAAAEYRGRVNTPPDDPRMSLPATATAPNKSENARDQDVLAKLERLAKLRSSGAIDENEFATLKRALMQGLC